METVLYVQQLMGELNTRFDSPAFAQRVSYFSQLRDRLPRRKPAKVARPAAVREPAHYSFYLP